MKMLQIALSVLAISLTVIGCAKQYSPVEMQPEANVVTPVFETDEPSVTSITRIIFPVPNQPADILYSEALVTPELGGTIKVKWTNFDPVGNKTSVVSIKLQVPARAVSVPTMIRVTVDKNSPEIGAEFAPHGLVFLKPAMLDVDATGLDLSDFSNNDRIDLFYIVDGGFDQQQQYKKFSLNTKKGTMAASNVQIPHFSAYAFGRAK